MERIMLTAQCDERHLISAAKAGNAAAFDLLVERYADSIFRLALRMLGNYEEAEDIQQETFLRAYRHLQHYRQDAAFVTWVYSIATRLCLSRRRGRMRGQREISLDGCPEMVESFVMHTAADGNSAGEHVQRALTMMAPDNRILIILKFIEGMSHEEIARVLGCSTDNSRVRLLRAKRQFRECYEKLGKETVD